MKRFLVTCATCGAKRFIERWNDPWLCPKNKTHKVRVTELSAGENRATKKEL